MDFMWVRFIGIKKLNLGLKEVMRLTIGQFRALYREYQDDFDTELIMRRSDTTYAKLREKAQQDEEWW